MQQSYHNTTDTVGPILNRYEADAKSQEEKILECFKVARISRDGYTPSDIWTVLFDQRCPLTSVRRGMSNLTNAGELVKTDKQVKGPYGRPEYQWRLAAKYDQGNLF